MGKYINIVKLGDAQVGLEWTQFEFRGGQYCSISQPSFVMTAHIVENSPEVFKQIEIITDEDILRKMKDSARSLSVMHDSVSFAIVLSKEEIEYLQSRFNE